MSTATRRANGLVLVCLPAAFAALATACGPKAPARTPLDQAPGADSSVVQALLASHGESVGAVRTALLPGGTAVAIFVPEPSDGYGPEVTVVRLDRGQPAIDTAVACGPFDWASTVSADQFMGMDPVEIASVETGAWDGTPSEDLLVTIRAEVPYARYGQSTGEARLLATCAFRLVDDPEMGRLVVPVMPLLLSAEVRDNAYGEETQVTEKHSVAPVAGEPGAIDFTVSTRTVSCGEFGDRGRECVPQTDTTTRRFRLTGSGMEASYQPIGGYYPIGGYRYPNGGIGTQYPDPAPIYDDTSTGYDDPATGYDDPSAGYDDSSAGYDEDSAGGDGDDDVEPSSSCNGR